MRKIQTDIMENGPFNNLMLADLEKLVRESKYIWRFQRHQGKNPFNSMKVQSGIASFAACLTFAEIFGASTTKSLSV